MAFSDGESCEQSCVRFGASSLELTEAGDGGPSVLASALQGTGRSGI